MKGRTHHMNSMQATVNGGLAPVLKGIKMAEHTCAVDGKENCYRCAELAEDERK